MYCSNKHFLQIAKEVWVKDHEFHTLLVVIFALIKKYGSLLKSMSLQKVIGEANPQIAKLILLLQKIDKLHVRDVHEMIDVLEAQSAQKSFSITTSLSWDMLDALQETLKEKFTKVDITVNKSDKPELQVAWNGWYYKRGLDRDLDKMLK